MKLCKHKHKVLHLKMDGEEKTLPVIYNSYIYTLWILSHKYENIQLLEIINTTSFPPPLKSSTYSYTFTLPNKTPDQLLDINNPIEVINYFGVDEYMLLNDFNVFDEIVELLIKGKVKNERNKLLGQFTTYFDSQLVDVSLGIQKINGLPVKYKGVPIYQLSGISRKGFNKLVDRTRDKLNIQSNKITLWNDEKKKKEINKSLTSMEREFMESQLQEFFNLLHERLGIGNT